VFAHLDARVLSYEVGVRKPNRAFFEHCRALAECPPEACLFIDDLLANVTGARACSWKAILYTGAAELRQGMAELGISTGPKSDRG
jgi:putative hydrolase of the HAD superfamily